MYVGRQDRRPSGGIRLIWYYWCHTDFSGVTRVTAGTCQKHYGYHGIAHMYTIASTYLELSGAAVCAYGLQHICAKGACFA